VLDDDMTTAREPPLILLSNDDGIAATGLHVLADAVAGLGEVWVVAPDREQSAKSHSISLHQPLRAHEVKPRWIAVAGTPTDCAYLAVNHLLPRRPTLLLSGINHGPNMGDDVHYSGTVAAAKEGALLGCAAAVAISLAGRAPFEADAFRGAARVVRDLTTKILTEGLPRGILLNVNVPVTSAERPPIRMCRLGQRRYTNEVDARFDPRGRPYFWIGGQELDFAPISGSDGEALSAGAVSVTPLRLDPTDESVLERLRSWEG
jgi:5'-nucleotidase